jgi:hypothetical protein
MTRAMAIILGLIALFFLLDLFGMKTIKEGLKNKRRNSDSDSGGISRDDIPDGTEDMYILKSEIVPPVCPACPSVQVCPASKHKCRPCPPCGRCPEPSFDCKKVPNYDAPQNQSLPGFYGNVGVAGSSSPIGGGSSQSSQPMPVLNSFSQFGM